MGEKSHSMSVIKITAVLVTLQKANVSFEPINTSEVLGKKVTKTSYFTKNNFIEYTKVCELIYFYAEIYRSNTETIFFHFLVYT